MGMIMLKMPSNPNQPTCQCFGAVGWLSGRAFVFQKYTTPTVLETSTDHQLTWVNLESGCKQWYACVQ